MKYIYVYQKILVILDSINTLNRVTLQYKIFNTNHYKILYKHTIALTSNQIKIDYKGSYFKQTYLERVCKLRKYTANEQEVSINLDLSEIQS